MRAAGPNFIVRRMGPREVELLRTWPAINRGRVFGITSLELG